MNTTFTISPKKSPATVNAVTNRFITPLKERTTGHGCPSAPPRNKNPDPLQSPRPRVSSRKIQSKTLVFNI